MSNHDFDRFTVGSTYTHLTVAYIDAVSDRLGLYSN